MSVRLSQDDISSVPPLVRTPLTIEKPSILAFFAGRMPLPPGVNHGYKPLYNGIVGTEGLVQFKADAASLLSQGYHDWSLINAIRASKRKVPLRADLHFFFRYLWKNDIDGPIKFAIDAAFRRLELNDVLLTDLHVVKHMDADDPRTEIEVYCDLSSR